MSKYPGIVSAVSSIEINEIHCRFILEITLNNKCEKTVLVFLKNPSTANEISPDKTVNNVINYCSQKYKKIVIVNLFPYYSTKAKGLLAYISKPSYKNIMDINRFYIKKLLETIDETIIGWGTNTIGMNQNAYDDLVKNAMTMLLSCSKPIYYVNCCKCSTGGCKSIAQCKRRCQRRCSRLTNTTKSCQDIRYPLHAELWISSDQQIIY